MFVVSVIVIFVLFVGVKIYELFVGFGFVMLVLDWFISVFFLIEIIIWFLVECKKWYFFKSFWNWFDIFIVIISLILVDDVELVVIVCLVRVFWVFCMILIIFEFRIFLVFLVKVFL